MQVNAERSCTALPHRHPRKRVVWVLEFSDQLRVNQNANTRYHKSFHVICVLYVHEHLRSTKYTCEHPQLLTALSVPHPLMLLSGGRAEVSTDTPRVLVIHRCVTKHPKRSGLHYTLMLLPVWAQLDKNSSALLHVPSARAAPLGPKVHFQGGPSHSWQVGEACQLGTQPGLSA